MLKFDLVSKTPQLVEFVNIFVDYLRKKIRPAYLFGSASWRLVLGEFDETKNDIDFLLHVDDIDADKQFIINICEMLSIELTEYKNMSENSYGNSRNYRVILNGNFRIDLVYAVISIDEFIRQMADVDIGMLIYNLHTNQHMVGGTGYIVTLKKIFSIARTKKMSLLYLAWYTDKTIKMSRIVKLMDHGFNFDPKYFGFEIIKSFLKSFYIPISYENLKCQVPLAQICMCTIRQYDKNFQEMCMNDKIYQFVKDVYLILLKTGIAQENVLIDRIIAYALCMKDYEFAKSQLDMYHDQIGEKIDRFNLTCIPMLLRTSNNFDLTLYFLEFFSKKHHINKFVFPSCLLPKQRVFQSFTTDAILSGNIEYYEKLVMYDSMFDIENMKHDALALSMYVYCMYQKYTNT